MNLFSKNRPTPPIPATKPDPVEVEADYLRSNTLPPSQMMWCATCGGRVLWVKGHTDYNVGTGRRGSHYTWRCENATSSYPVRPVYPRHYGENDYMMYFRQVTRWYESEKQFIDPWILEREFMNPSVPVPSETMGSM